MSKADDGQREPPYVKRVDWTCDVDVRRGRVVPEPTVHFVCSCEGEITIRESEPVECHECGDVWDIHNGGIDFDRHWHMPNSETFQITPLEDLLNEEIQKSDGLWIDPFSGEADYADITNDLNPDIQSDYTMDACDFLSKFDDREVDGGVIFDPPYSPRQIKECYQRIGLETTMETTQATFWSNAKDEIARVCGSGATAVTFGWNSGGIGKTNGFEIRRITLCAHGGWHNDTIAVVEDVAQSTLGESVDSD